MNSNLLLPLVGYLILIFLLSYIAYRQRIKEHFLQEYFLGSRTMGGFMLAMTLTTTYISASSFIGGPGAAYQFGLGWVLLALIQLPAVWFAVTILGKKFAILARRYQAITLNDMLFARYQSRLIVWFASISLLIAFLAAMTVQFIGGARLLESATGLSYGSGLLIFGVTLALYTAIGGFRASLLNDAMQGIVMLVGTVIFLLAVIHAAGGLPNAIDTLNKIDPALTTPQGPNQMFSFPFMASFWILVCFGIVGLPHTAVRCIAYRDSHSMHQGIIIGTIIVFVIMLGMHLAGALGRAIIPDLASPDQIIPTLMIKVLPSFWAGVFLAAPIAAIMSTINAQLLQSSATLIKNLYLDFWPHQITHHRRLKRLSMVLTFTIGMILIILAWHPPKMIIWLNLLAFGGLEAVFLWPLVLGLYWNKANATGALSSMVGGAGCYIFMLIYQLQPYGFNPIVPTLALGLILFYIGNYLGEERNIVHNII